MRRIRSFLMLSFMVCLIAACAQPAPNRADSNAQPAAPPGVPKVVTIGLNEDPPGMWEVATQVGGAGGRQLLPVVSQFLAVIGSDGTAHPRLLAELPSLQNGTWELLPDGTMETTWKLRANAVWHDGTAFTAED